MSKKKQTAKSHSAKSIIPDDEPNALVAGESKAASKAKIAGVDKGKYRNFVFTYNNYTKEGVEFVNEMDCKYLLYAYEVGKTGTPHLQGYVVFHSQRTLSAVYKKMQPIGENNIGNKNHINWKIAVPHATIDDQVSYICGPYEKIGKDGKLKTKPVNDNFYERGQRPMSQKVKGDKGAEQLRKQWQAAKEGRFEDLPISQLKIAEYIHRKYQQESIQSRQYLDNILIYGSPGSGKTTFIKSYYPKYSDVYKKDCSHWYDGCQTNQDVLVLEDFDKHCLEKIGFSAFKNLCDFDPLNVQCKNGFLHIRPKMVIVTANYNISEWCEDPIMYQAIMERFIIFMIDPVTKDANQVQNLLYRGNNDKDIYINPNRKANMLDPTHRNPFERHVPVDERLMTTSVFDTTTEGSELSDI
jgi:GTPase SAR1 family protein